MAVVRAQYRHLRTIRESIYGKYAYIALHLTRTPSSLLHRNVKHDPVPVKKATVI